MKQIKIIQYIGIRNYLKVPILLFRAKPRKRIARDLQDR